MTEHKGFTLWITGPDAAGRDALAGEVGGVLLERGCRAEILDSGVVARELTAAGESDAEAVAARACFVASLLARGGVIACCAADSRTRAGRSALKDAADSPFVVVFAAGGDAQGYEPPDDAEVVLPESDDLDTRRGKVLLTLESLGLVPRDEAAEYSDEEEQEVMRRLKDLGYV